MHQFLSSEQVCLKACVDPTPGKLCENRFDTFGVRPASAPLADSACAT